MILEKELSEIYLTNKIEGNTKNLFILKGFEAKQLSNLSEKNYLFKDIHYSNLFEMVDQITKWIDDPSALINISQLLNSQIPRFVWMKYEEYLVIKKKNKQALIQFFEQRIITNNLYYSEFPISIEIPQIDDIYQQIFLNDDDILDEEQQEKLDKISNVYGNINLNKLNNSYYATYTDNETSIPVTAFYDDFETLDDVYEITDQISDENIFALNDNEDQILSLTSAVLNNKSKVSNLYVIFDTSESNYHNYKLRIELLNALSNVADIQIAKRIQQKKVIKRLPSYLEVLKDRWGYKEFRNISMYRDPKINNELTEVSQAQIIDDIVEQAEVGLSGKQPRDVFITASTGAGKSVMFQLPSFYLSEKYSKEKPLTIVIQPLIGLMNDQVQSLKDKGVNSVATINSNIDPIEKQKSIEKIQNGEIDILFISTETLQNKSDIKMLIGDRTIGLFIVDEAHTVTTWGKTFRADYWYMGLYLTKLRKQYNFPIVTFTATAIYGGPEDMYRETIDSLNLIEPITYIGYVKRDDIFMVIDHKEKKEQNEYLKAKQTELLKRLRKFVKAKQKTLVYFPTVKSLHSANNFIDSVDPNLGKTIRKYYGPLNPAEKQITFDDFKSGEALVVFATKAFGMGIDISDINNVYHYSPTGDVVDYVQEIGRAAREKELRGTAGMLFLPNDMNAIKQLHGMSAVRKSQIIAVMRKILSIYKTNHYNRNLVISADDFKYVLQLNDYEDLDNKIKIILLMIEKDFEQGRLGYAPFVARPKPVFGNELVFLKSDVEEDKILSGTYGKYLEKKYNFKGTGYKAVYDFNLETLWKEKFQKNNISYPYFKKMVFDDDDKLSSGLRKFIGKSLVFATGIDISIDGIFADTEERYHRIFNDYKNFAREHAIKQTMFKVEDLAEFISINSGIKSWSESVGIATALINASLQIAKSIKSRSINAKMGNQTGSYVINNGYIQLFDIFSESIRRIFHGSLSSYTKNAIHLYYRRQSSNQQYEQSKLIEDIAVLGIGESLSELTYEIKNGNNPQIYLRINSIQSLEKAVENEQGYQNKLLNIVHWKYKVNVAFLTYLFKHESDGIGQEKIFNYSQWFWNEIERYFLGKIPNEVMEKVNSKSK